MAAATFGPGEDGPEGGGWWSAIRAGAAGGAGATRHRKVHFEALEPRLLLSADPISYTAAAASDLTLRVDDQTIELVVTETDVVVASQLLSDARDITITGSSEADKLRIDISTQFTQTVIFDGKGASDALLILGGKAEDVPDTGTAGDGTVTLGEGPTTASVDYTGVEAVSTPFFFAGTAGADLTLRSTGAALELTDDSDNSLVTSQALSDTTEVIIRGADGESDTLTVDLLNDIAFPIAYDGGAGAGSDSLMLTGATSTTVTYAATGSDSGTIDLDGAVITYTGLEPVLDLTVADNRVFDFTGAQNIVLSDAASAGATTVSSGAGGFEAVTFANPTASLTINAGDGQDVVDVAALDSASTAALTINAGDGDDAVSITGLGAVPAAITIVGDEGSDTTTIDATVLGFGGTLSVDGGDGPGSDSLVVTGGVFTDVVYAASGPSSGTISYDGAGLVYDGLEPITDTTTAANRVFDFTGAQ